MKNISRRRFIDTVAGAGSAYFFGSISGCGEPEQKIENMNITRRHPLDIIERENIKITDVRVRLFSCEIPLDKWWYGCGVTILTEVYTDQGITGIGGPSPYGGPEPVKKFTEEIIKPAVTGRNPFDLDFFSGEGMDFMKACAWAGIDHACWDIIGKTKGLPVYKLLATDNEPNPHVLHYASGGTLHNWKKRSEELYDEALRYKEEGYTAFKFRMGEEWESEMTVKKYIPFIEKLRETVGYDFDLIHENNMRMNFEQVLKFAPTLETLKFLWLEEPISRFGQRSEDGVEGAIQNHIKICEALPTVKVSGGETMKTRFEFKEWIERDAYDIIQPDCDTTGLTEGWYIARMANLKGKTCIPHSWHGGLTWMSNIQLVAAIPNSSILESNRHYNPFREGLFKEPLVVKNSYVDIPDRPGLGLEIIDDADKKFPYDPKNNWFETQKLRS